MYCVVGYNSVHRSMMRREPFVLVSYCPSSTHVGLSITSIALTVSKIYQKGKVCFTHPLNNVGYEHSIYKHLICMLIGLLDLSDADFDPGSADV